MVNEKGAIAEVGMYLHRNDFYLLFSHCYLQTKVNCVKNFKLAIINECEIEIEYELRARIVID